MNQPVSNSGYAIPLKSDWSDLFFSSGMVRLLCRNSTGVEKCGGSEDRMNRITINQARIFGYIFSRPNQDIRLNTLAHDLDVTAAAASQAVNRLVSAKLLRRKTDPSDHRAIILSISPQGLEILQKNDDYAFQLFSDIYKENNFSPEEIATFRKVLTGIYQSLLTRWNHYLESKH